MPKAWESGPYRFFFWSNENSEPPHVHVQRDRLEAKFWLDPLVELAANWGFRRHELNLIRQMVEENRSLVLEKWREHFGET